MNDEDSSGVGNEGVRQSSSPVKQQSPINNYAIRLNKYA